MPFQHTCVCGTKLKLKDELAGKKIKCPKCSEVIALPTQSVQSTPSSGGLFDENFPDLGLPTAAQVAYHPPVSQPTYKMAGGSKEPAESKAPTRNGGIQINFNQDALALVTAILCILFGFGSLFSFGVIGLLIAKGSLFSITGLVYVFSTFISLGIFAAGVGILTQQDWAVNVGQISASLYFVLVMVHIVLFVGGLATLGGSSVSGTDIARSFILFFSSLITQSIAPGLLLYLTFRDN